MKIRNNFLLLLMATCILMCQSCKQGCTDPHAFNYVKGAKQDDASCLYCDSSIRSAITSNSYTYYDYNSGSPHYGSAVLYMYITENQRQYTGNGCKLLGVSNSNCIQYSFVAQLYNQTGSTMNLTGDLYTSTNFSSTTHRFNALSIPPNGSVTVDVGSFCDNGFSFYSNLQNYIFQYH